MTRLGGAAREPPALLCAPRRARYRGNVVVARRIGPAAGGDRPAGRRPACARRRRRGAPAMASARRQAATGATARVLVTAAQGSIKKRRRRRRGIAVLPGGGLAAAAKPACIGSIAALVPSRSIRPTYRNLGRRRRRRHLCDRPCRGARRRRRGVNAHVGMPAATRLAGVVIDSKRKAESRAS